MLCFVATHLAFNCTCPLLPHSFRFTRFSGCVAPFSFPGAHSGVSSRVEELAEHGGGVLRHDLPSGSEQRQQQEQQHGEAKGGSPAYYNERFLLDKLESKPEEASAGSVHGAQQIDAGGALPGKHGQGGGPAGKGERESRNPLILPDFQPGPQQMALDADSPGEQLEDEGRDAKRSFSRQLRQLLLASSSSSPPPPPSLYPREFWRLRVA